MDSKYYDWSDLDIKQYQDFLKNYSLENSCCKMCLGKGRISVTVHTTCIGDIMEEMS
jgi:hypothetical protein